MLIVKKMTKHYVKSMSHKKGYTLLQALLAFSIAIQANVMLTMSLKIILESTKDERIVDRMLGLDQVRILLAASDDIKVEHDTITFINKAKPAYLEIDHDRLVKRPGYVMYIKGLTHARFLQQGNSIYLVYGPKQVMELLYVQ